MLLRRIATLAPLLGVLLAALTAPLAAQEVQVRDFPFLGVSTESIRPNEPESGLRITYVFPHSAAQAMGLREGDEIIALNDFLIDSLETFLRELRREKIGARLRFVLRRDGERVKLSGKIGSYRKTMVALQEDLRKSLYGKPPPEFPEVLWWDAQKKELVEREDWLEKLEGKLTAIVSFDDCPTCRQHRYGKFQQMAGLFTKTQPSAPLSFAGIYQSDVQDQEQTTREHARKLFEATPPNFSCGVALFPEGPPSQKDREKRLYLHNHGILVLDTEGKVRFLQIVGVPGPEFGQAYQKLLLEAAGKSAPPKESKPSPEDPAPEDAGKETSARGNPGE